MGPAPRTELTGLVLAGGRSRRMGRDKASIPWPPGSGSTLLEHLLAVLEPLCREVMVVGRPHPGGRWVADAPPGEGPLRGLEAGLAAAPTSWSLAVACDLPFLEPRMVERLREHAAGDAVVPRVGGRPQPLLALYRRTCLEPIRSALDRGERRMEAFWAEVEVRFLEEEALRAADAELLSFRNLNEPADLEQALDLWRCLLEGGKLPGPPAGA